MRRYRRRIKRAQRNDQRNAEAPPKLPLVLAEIFSYADLLAAVKSRRHALHLSQSQVDEIAGFTEQYTSKLEMGPLRRDPFALRLAREAAALRRKERNRRNPDTKAGRALGDMSLPVLLQALRCKLVLVETGERER